MQQSYQIFMHDVAVGTADIFRKGLYYHILCRCTFSDNHIYRITVHCDGQDTDLGICVPLEECFGLQTQIPVKQIGVGDLNFSAVLNNSLSMHFIHVTHDEPFEYLHKLNVAVLGKHNGLIGVLIQNESSNPTGQ